MASESKLRTRIRDLEQALKEATDTLAAIRKGEVDAFVVSGPGGDNVYTLKGADSPYRILVENMREGALTLTPDGLILYTNRRFSELVGLRPEKIVGSHIQNFVAKSDATRAAALLLKGALGNTGGEVALKAAQGKEIPAFLSFNSFQLDEATVVCLIVFDLTEQKRADEIVAAERLARAILEQAAEAVVVVDRSGKIIRASGAAAALSGREILLRDFARVFPLSIEAGTSGIGDAQDIYLAASSGRTIKGIAAVLPRVSKPPSYVLASAGPLLGPQAEPLGCVITLTDITAQRNAERDLRQANDTVNAIIAGSPVAIWLVDTAGNIVLWNPAAEKLFGYALREAVSKPGLFHLKTPSGTEMDDRLANGEVIVALDAVCEKRDGSCVDVSLSTSVLRNLDGTRRGFVALAIDVTEQKKIQEQIRQAQKLESIGLLAGGIAHDFNNLLTGIIGNASIVVESVSKESQGYIRDILKAGARAASLTRQLLAYAGKGQFVLEPIDLSSVVEEFFPLVQGSVPQKAEVQLDLDHQLPAVKADQSQIEQVLMNLVINAGEALGDIPGRITIRTGVLELNSRRARDFGAPAGRYACLEVIDTGCGMDRKTQEKMFEPFFSTKFTGRGLGLAAVHGIVRSSGGGIKVVSNPGRGTRMTVLFPVIEQPAALEATEAESLSRGSGVILVVDDEALIRSTTAAILQYYGYTVITAANGKEAVERFREAPDRIDAVLLDVAMPVMDGHEVLIEMQRIRPNVKVLVSTGHDEGKAHETFEHESVAGFLQKPYRATTLAKALQAVIESDQKTQAGG